MEQTRYLQQILGTDKRNPSFTVFRDSAGEQLHVYYGAQLFEVVPADKEAPGFKLLVGKLYNANVNAKRLREAFGVARQTMKKWGDALKSNDPEELVRALRGRGGHRKLTAEVQAYVRVRFPLIYAETRYEYSKRMRAEIEAVFGKSLSAETLRPLFKELKQEVAGVAVPPAAPAKHDTAGDCPAMAPGPPAAPGRGDEPPEPPRTDPGGSANRKECFASAPAAASIVTVCHHVGVLLFSTVALQVQACVAEGGAWLKQWLCTILLGAVNIEQTKLLDFGSLIRLLGRAWASLRPQREELGRLACPQNVDAVLRLNADLVGLHEGQDFYYDPHGKHYTGVQKVLKGWCAAVRGVAKTLYMDFIHTADGHPVYVKHTDNYDDLRTRFGPTVDAFRQSLRIPPERVLTFVVDRGLYSHDVFEQIIDTPQSHVITWQKGYRPVPWDKQEISGSFRLQRTRNHSTDRRTYEFEYTDGPWPRDPRMRLLRVQATNPQGRTVQVGVLTDDRDRQAERIIVLIFSRWIQENDFKYLDTHFGINQITSYASVAYRQLQDHLEERQMKSGEYKALEQARRAVSAELKTLLLQEHRHAGKNRNRPVRIAELDQRDRDLDAQMSATDKDMSRLDHLIEQDYVRLDTRSKALMDALKLLARNAFYAALAPFQEAYDNYRDDHVLFRNLTRAHGLLIEHGDEVEVLLNPTANYPPKLTRIVHDMLEQINATGPLMPDGSGRRLRFRLAENEHIQLAIAQEASEANY